MTLNFDLMIVVCGICCLVQPFVVDDRSFRDSAKDLQQTNQIWCWFIMNPLPNLEKIYHPRRKVAQGNNLQFTLLSLLDRFTVETHANFDLTSILSSTHRVHSFSLFGTQIASQTASYRKVLSKLIHKRMLNVLVFIYVRFYKSGFQSLNLNYWKLKMKISFPLTRKFN